MARHRIFNPTLEVEWFGFRANLHDLYQHGWDVAMEEDWATRAWRLYLKRRDLAGHHIYGFSDMGRRHGFSNRGEAYRDVMERCLAGPSAMYQTPIHTHVVVGQDIHITCPTPVNQDNIRMVETIPAVADFERTYVSNMRIFRERAPERAEKEIPLLEPTLNEILDIALAKQAPAQERIRKGLLQQSELKAQLRLVA